MKHVSSNPMKYNTLRIYQVSDAESAVALLEAYQKELDNVIKAYRELGEIEGDVKAFEMPEVESYQDVASLGREMANKIPALNSRLDNLMFQYQVRQNRKNNPSIGREQDVAPVTVADAPSKDESAIVEVKEDKEELETTRILQMKEATKEAEEETKEETKDETPKDESKNTKVKVPTLAGTKTKPRKKKKSTKSNKKK